MLSYFLYFYILLYVLYMFIFLYTSLWFNFVGLYAFYMLEVVMSFFRKGSTPSHGHSHLQYELGESEVSKQRNNTRNKR